MNPAEKTYSLRVLLLISTKKLADKAEMLFHHGHLPLLYRLHAVGTASSEMMDILGLGSIDKGVLVSAMPKVLADKMLHKLHDQLGLGMPGSGVAFTLPLSSASTVIFKMLQPTVSGESANGKEENIMLNCKHSLM